MDILSHTILVLASLLAMTLWIKKRFDGFDSNLRMIDSRVSRVEGGIMRQESYAVIRKLK